MSISKNGTIDSISVAGVIRSIAETNLHKAVQLALSYKRDADLRFGSETTSIGSRLKTIISVAEHGENFAELQSILLEESDPSKIANNLDVLYQSWGKHEFEDPLSAIKALQNPEQSNSAMSGFLKGWAETDRKAAFPYAIENQSDNAVAKALPNTTSKLVFETNTEERDEIESLLDVIKTKNFLRVPFFASSAKPALKLVFNSHQKSKAQRSDNKTFKVL